jgi:hypothetical protein
MAEFGDLYKIDKTSTTMLIYALVVQKQLRDDSLNIFALFF